jgi:hypothetical protein
VAVRRVLPLYLVVFVGFVGYSLMIAIFTPLLLRPDGALFVAWVAVPIVAANLGLVAWLAKRMTPAQTAMRAAVVMAIAMAAIVIPRVEGALWVTLGVTALAIAVCLPAAAAIISDAVTPSEQGSALGSNQSLQVGAESLAGLGGGLLAAIATALPLPVLAAFSLGAAGRLRRETAGHSGPVPS